MSALHIGAAGELLVQYRLLKLGLDSARLTTDAGTDLVVYSSVGNTALTVQVKAKERPTPAGGSGPLAASWSFRHDTNVDLLAFVLLSADAVWVFTAEEARALAQQHRHDGSRLLYWFTGIGPKRLSPTQLFQADHEEHLLERKMPSLLARSRTSKG